MQKYRVLLSRAVTEETWVTVEASCTSEASNLAEDIFSDVPHREWDTICINCVESLKTEEI